jgi:hypothetical protein
VWRFRENKWGKINKYLTENWAYFWCLDDPSTDELTLRQFSPHYPSTLRIVCCDSSPLLHSVTYTIHPGIFRPPQLRGGQFVTCDMTSILLKLLCDMMSTLSWSEMWTFCCMIFGPICDVLPHPQRTEDDLSQDYFDTFVCVCVFVCVRPPTHGSMCRVP